VDTVVAEWGRLDVLVNNAGIVRDATLGKVSDEDWTATLDVNLRGAMIGTRAALRPMCAAGAGRILSATSVVARMGNYGQTAYAASKAGIIGLTRAWARELGPLGITANAVAPGFIDTDMARGVPEKVLSTLLQRTAARRLGRPEEVAAVYVFLASDLASFINGAVVGVDGGLLLLGRPRPGRRRCSPARSSFASLSRSSSTSRSSTGTSTTTSRMACSSRSIPRRC